jgi:hypothetical protein
MGWCQSVRAKMVQFRPEIWISLLRSTLSCNRYMYRIKCYVPTAKTCDLGQQFPVGWEYMPGWSGHLIDWLLWDRAPHIAATGRELAGRGRGRRLAGWLASRGGGGNPTELI